MNDYEDIHALLGVCAQAAHSAHAFRARPERMMFMRLGRDEGGRMIEMSGVVERRRSVTPLTRAEKLPRRAPNRKGANEKHGCGCKACEEKTK